MVGFPCWFLYELRSARLLQKVFVVDSSFVRVQGRPLLRYVVMRIEAGYSAKHIKFGLRNTLSIWTTKQETPQ